MRDHDARGADGSGGDLAAECRALGKRDRHAGPGDDGRKHRPGDDRLGNSIPTRSRELVCECVPDPPEPERRDENPRNEDECRQRRRRDDAEQTPEVAAGNRLRERRAHP